MSEKDLHAYHWSFRLHGDDETYAITVSTDSPHHEMTAHAMWQKAVEECEWVSVAEHVVVKAGKQQETLRQMAKELLH